MEFQNVKIGKFANVLSGYAFKSSEFIEDGIPIIKIKNIRVGSIDLDDVQFVDKSYLDLNQKFHVKKGDLLISLTGSHLTQPNSVVGRVARYSGPHALLNQRAGKIMFEDGNICDRKFLYYLLSTIEYKRKLALFASGAASQANISPSQVESLEIKLPNVEIQQKIASLLFAFDDLIENNSRRIEILEEMARRIYREWFVHFRYPGHENDTLVDSGTDLGEIPEGWEALKLGETLSKLESGKRPKGGVSKYDDGIPSVGAENVLGVGQYNYSKEKYVPEEFYEGMNKGVVEDYDVLIYKDGASLGRVSIFGDGFPHRKLCINSHAYLVRTDNTCSQAYLYFWMDSPMIKSTIRNSNTNAAQPGINMGDVKGFPLLVPSEKILGKFNKIGDPIVSQIFQLAKKNQRLKETRDLLLPKLISGKIDVEGKEWAGRKEMEAKFYD